MTLVAWSVPSHCLNQCWNSVSWSPGRKHGAILFLTKYIFIHENSISLEYGCYFNSASMCSEDRLWLLTFIWAIVMISQCKPYQRTSMEIYHKFSYKRNALEIGTCKCKLVSGTCKTCVDRAHKISGDMIKPFNVWLYCSNGQHGTTVVAIDCTSPNRAQDL